MRPRAYALRRNFGIYGYERALAQRGLAPVAGVDEAGRGACAGPLVAAAVVLPAGRGGSVPGLADSKELTPAARDDVYAEIVSRARSWGVVAVPPAEVDRRGVHVANVVAMRRALARLSVQPAYVLSDGFPVEGAGAPNLAVWKGDRVAACVAAASVIAKVTRDQIMVDLHEHHPSYGFAQHKGYVTTRHAAALHEHGPCMQHRMSYANVARVAERVNAGAARDGDAAGCGPDPADTEGVHTDDASPTLVTVGHGDEPAHGHISGYGGHDGYGGQRDHEYATVNGEASIGRDLAMRRLPPVGHNGNSL